MCLSAHRKYSLGSASAPVRQRGLDIMARAIGFAVEFGLRIVQVAGYDVFYEESTQQTRDLYLQSLCRASEWAAQAGVMLGLENVDCPVVDSVSRALPFVAAVRSPWFQLYPDIANLAAMGHEVAAQLREAGEHLVAVHIKDGRLGEIAGPLRPGPRRLQGRLLDAAGARFRGTAGGRDVERGRGGSDRGRRPHLAVAARGA